MTLGFLIEKYLIMIEIKYLKCKLNPSRFPIKDRATVHLLKVREYFQILTINKFQKKFDLPKKLD